MRLVVENSSSAGLNNKAKWSKQNVAKCFCKVRNHAQCFILNTSGKYHCCFRIKDLNAVSNPKFFHVSDMTIFRDFQGPRPRRDIGMARPGHSKTCLEISSSGSYHCQQWDKCRPLSQQSKRRYQCGRFGVGLG